MLTGFDFIPGIPAHWFWTALVIIFAVIEVFTLGLTTVWFALAALVMVFVSLAKIPLAYQILIFLAISTLLLIFTRPLAIKKFKMGKEKTNVDGLIGKHALVTLAIGEFEKGEVKLNGQIWSARAEDGLAVSVGTRCEVVRIEGVQAIVRPLAESPAAENPAANGS